MKEIIEMLKESLPNYCRWLCLVVKIVELGVGFWEKKAKQKKILAKKSKIKRKSKTRKKR